MKKPDHLPKAIVPVTESLNHRLWRRHLFLIAVALTAACLAVSPAGQAQTCREGCDSLNTFLGLDALLNNINGHNTAIGLYALYADTTGTFNVASGEYALESNTTGSNNTASGNQALYYNTTGDYNTAVGDSSLGHNTTGSYNVACGGLALVFNAGSDNTAIGFDALSFNSGASNIAVGSYALTGNYTGSFNTATGANALFTNTTGGSNTASGYQALYKNTTGSANTANGLSTLYSNTSGGKNATNGYQALYFNTIGSQNTANGFQALLNNKTSSNETANGYQALFSNTTGASNTAIGASSLFKNTTGFNNTADGNAALFSNTTGTNNIGLGNFAGSALTTGTFNIDIGSIGAAGESATIRIGTSGSQTKTYITGISGVTVAGGVGVIVDSSGHLGTVVSSERFKDAIKPMDKASESILALKPVTFRYKHELDPEGIPQFGLVAEQVAKVNPDLVARDEQGKPYTVRYEAVNAMLLNEFLKEHRKVEELKSTVAKQEAIVAQQQKDFQTTAAEQQKEIKALTAIVKEQASQIQKVSAQLEVAKPTPQMVLNNQ